MQPIEYEISCDESVTRWWVTDIHKEPFESPRETFDAPVNLGEGYVQIVYPVRKAFLAQNGIQSREYYGGPWSTVYFPFENNRVDFTTFIHTPHHFWLYARTLLRAPEGGSYSFDVYTCGGMKIWVNGKEALCFAPYTRNIPGRTRIDLPLSAGDNEIVVYADELAERDVFFYYELRYRGQTPLTGVLPLEKGGDEILAAERFLKSCYFERDCVYEGDLSLCYDGSIISSDVALSIEGDPGSAKLNNIELEGAPRVIARSGGSRVSLGDIRKYNIGIFKLFASMSAGGFDIRRALVVGVLPRAVTDFSAAKTILERKRQALEFIAGHGETVVNRTMVHLETGRGLSEFALSCLRNSVEMIRNKEDCADFYLVPAFLLITRYRAHLPDSVYLEIKKCILDFRYWIDEPGNDVMWYFSENHAFLFHVSQYLAGWLFPDETFSSSEKSGREQYGIGKKRVVDWFATFFRYGYAEWNSATYIPIDLIGFFILFEMAPDEDIRRMAKDALDFTFKIVKYNSFNGVMSSSYGRSYEDTLKAREQVEPSFLEWVAWGSGYVNFRSRAVSLFCLSSYEPPAFDAETRLSGRQWMEVEFDQGMHKVKTYSFRTTDYFIACVRRFKPFVHGHQQHVMNVALGKKSVQFYLNHPGERSFSGDNRPCYWAGNGTNPYVEQYRNLMVMRYRIDPDELVHYIHAYCTRYDYDESLIEGKWFFARTGDAYVAAWFSAGVEAVTSGANAGKELIARGLDHEIVVKCGSAFEWGSFAEFASSILRAHVSAVADGILSFVDPQYGEVALYPDGKFSVGGSDVVYADAAEMKIRRGDL